MEGGEQGGCGSWDCGIESLWRAILLSARTAAVRIGIIMTVSGGLAALRSQQSTKSLGADDLALVPFVLRLDDLVEALASSFVMTVLEVLRKDVT